MIQSTVAPSKVVNCWDFKRCKDKENCPAYPHAGTKCAYLVGTLCNGNKATGILKKIHDCDKCEFFKIHINNEID